MLRNFWRSPVEVGSSSHFFTGLVTKILFGNKTHMDPMGVGKYYGKYRFQIRANRSGTTFPERSFRVVSTERHRSIRMTVWIVPPRKIWYTRPNGWKVTSAELIFQNTHGGCAMGRTVAQKTLQIYLPHILHVWNYLPTCHLNLLVKCR